MAAAGTFYPLVGKTMNPQQLAASPQIILSKATKFPMD